MFINFGLALIDVACGRKQKDKIALYQNRRDLERNRQYFWGREGVLELKIILELIRMVYKYLSRDIKKATEYEFRRQVWTEATYLLIIA